ncbi:Putative hypothetical protein [Helicobacter mustelae 12198]|uniref:Uncharacterized protein n=1 Tax=Helicobacter mustelae (strain ATCC 43772 / CCUG 25715 / CIP 103759 / LMG 18044 / NCTC 12198 / R85-136P) TaxID=679897 RepID=D3UFZ3_HELM1|nr:Putative hypothetical protein [Helicobacter mustelae 12198]SQH70927.1 Uncharacterised protein [Helicobacter mustelae]
MVGRILVQNLKYFKNKLYFYKILGKIFHLYQRYSTYSTNPWQKKNFCARILGSLLPLPDSHSLTKGRLSIYSSISKEGCEILPYPFMQYSSCDSKNTLQKIRDDPPTPRRWRFKKIPEMQHHAISLEERTKPLFYSREKSKCLGRFLKRPLPRSSPTHKRLSVILLFICVSLFLNPL